MEDTALKYQAPASVILTLFVFFSILRPLDAEAQSREITSTCFYWPTGTRNYSAGGFSGWLADRCEWSGNMDYDEGKYHPATDIGAPEGDPVYAIADGEIVYISVNGWEENNYGIFIKHKLNTGEEFLALYGHIVPDSGDL